MRFSHQRGCVSEVSGDEFFHLGMDELHWDCWDVPHINAWMATVGIAPGDHKGIARYYLERVQAVLAKHGKRGIVWNEAFDQYGAATYPPATPAPRQLRADTVVHLWFSPTWYDPPTGLPVAKTLEQVVVTGRDALISFPWYLNANASAGPSFESLYLQDVQSNKTCETGAHGELNCTCFGRNGDVEDSCYDVSDQPELLSHVLGGEAALWGEAVNGANVEAATFMAAAVVAERLWSPRTALDVADARRRLGAMRAVMRGRGLAPAGMPP